MATLDEPVDDSPVETVSRSRGQQMFVNPVKDAIDKMARAIDTMARAEKEIQQLRSQRDELLLQVEILTSYLEPMSEKVCRCANNGDFCDYHNMMYEASISMRRCRNGV